MPFWELQSTNKAEMKVLKSWSKSEISLRTAVMKIFNFSQNFDSTSNFQEIIQIEHREHSRMPFWDLQSTNKTEMKVLKSWSKSEISQKTAVMKIFNFLQNFDSTSNFQKSFKSNIENTPECHFETCNSFTSLKCKSWKVGQNLKISLRTAVMKIFNYWQNFDSTSNFQKSFKWTREHSWMPFWGLQSTYKAEMKVLKSWSKSEISLRTAVMKIFIFWQNLTQPPNFHKSFKWTREHSRMPFSEMKSTYKAEMQVLKS